MQKELNNFKKKKFNKPPVIFFSFVTDPYQPLEAKYKLTRKCLEIIQNSNLNFKISILTKSSLVVRNIDIFKNFNDISVGLTVTGTNDKNIKILEKRAPVISERLKALTTLNKNKINTYAFIGPILPEAYLTKGYINDLLKKIKDTGTNEVWFEHINISEKRFNELNKNNKYLKKDDILNLQKECENKMLKFAKEVGLTIKNNKIYNHKKDKI